jgi:hypothetical protein
MLKLAIIKEIQRYIKEMLCFFEIILKIPLDNDKRSVYNKKA